MSDTGGVVGRERELATVAAFLDALPSWPAGLLLEGEAGIGKTTVWLAGVTGAAERSCIILSSRPAESEATLSFAALGDLMDGVIGQVLPQLPPPQRRALEVALLIADPVGSPPAQRAVCLAFLGVIRHLSASGPVLIAIDDLQWLDLPSAAALEFALRRLGSEPVGLLASVRIQADGHAASAAGAGLPAGRLTRLQVGPLTVAAFEAALRARVGSRLSRLTVRRIFDASGGNPFYGLELARALNRVGSEPSPGEPLPVPADLRGVLSARLAVLPDGVRDVLLAASCLRSPTTTTLARADDPPALAALQTAALEGVVEIEGTRVRFTHPLLALLEQALQAAREEGDDSSLPLVLAYLADLECWAGNWQTAEHYAAECWEAGERVEHRVWRSMTFYARALMDAQLGRVDAARAGAGEGLSVAAAAGDAWATHFAGWRPGVRGTVGREPAGGRGQPVQGRRSCRPHRPGRAGGVAFPRQPCRGRDRPGRPRPGRKAPGTACGMGSHQRTRMDAGYRGPLPGAAAGGQRRHRRRRPGAGGGH